MHCWYDDAIFYNLYPLGAVNAKHNNDYVQTTEGLDRLSDWIPHIGKIGCNALYLGPIFESYTHGYDTTDYRKVDSRLGTNLQFQSFVKWCHDAGIKVVLDGVFNHTGRDFFAFKDIRENKSASRYKDWYLGMNFGGNSPLNDGFTYEAWRGHYELPRLNPHNTAVREYLFDTVRMWIQDFDVDGIRLDCADCLDFGFMKELRRVCVGEKPDFWLMGEIIHGDYTRWANADTLHSVTNYECQKGLYSSHNDGNMHEIGHSLGRQFGSGGIYKDLMLYNFADNHDLNRLADTVKNPVHLPTIYTLLYTMPGIPSVYYGSEWGIHGVSDRVTDWALRPEIDIRTAHFDHPELMEHITRLAEIRKGSDALRHGDYIQLAVASHQLAFRRSVDGDTAIVLVNCADSSAQLSLDTGGSGWRDALSGKTYSSGRVSVDLPAYGSAILLSSSGSVGEASSPRSWTQPAVSPPSRPIESPAPTPAPDGAAGSAAQAQAEPAPQPAPQEPARPASPAQPPKAGEDGKIIIANANDVPMERVAEHPVFEHGRYRVVDTGRCKVTIYELAPGKSAYPYHYHTAREEVFYILSGKGLLRSDSGERSVQAGDLIHFPAGKAGAHRLINVHHEPLRYIDFDAMAPGDVAVMPDSRKVNFGDGNVYRLGDPAGYYDGE